LRNKNDPLIYALDEMGVWWVSSFWLILLNLILIKVNADQ